MPMKGIINQRKAVIHLFHLSEYFTYPNHRISKGVRISEDVLYIYILPQQNIDIMAQ